MTMSCTKCVCKCTHLLTFKVILFNMSWIPSMFYHYFVIISFLKTVWPFISRKLNPHHPRMLCAKFIWNWPSGSKGKGFVNFFNIFMLIRNYLLIIKLGMALLLNKPEFPFPKDAVCQVCLNLLIGSSKEELQMSSMYFRHFVIVFL